MHFPFYNYSLLGMDIHTSITLCASTPLYLYISVHLPRYSSQAPVCHCVNSGTKNEEKLFIMAIMLPQHTNIITIIIINSLFVIVLGGFFFCLLYSQVLHITHLTMRHSSSDQSAVRSAGGTK